MGRKVKVQDPQGEAWHAEARGRWDRAVQEMPEEPLAVYEAVPLPDWNASRPVHVSRDLLGRFLQDRDTGTVHDCYAATHECRLDGIRNGTFFHFWAEVQALAADDLPCPLCIP